MTKLGNPATITALSAAIIAVLILGTMLYTKHHTAPTYAATKTSSTKQQKTQSQTNVSSHAAQAASNSNGPAAKTSPADQAVSANMAPAVTDACKLLTESVAKQVVGGNAQTTTTSSTSATSANDTTLTSCAYSGSGGTVQLTIRASNGSLGTSENDLEFGSSRPKNAAAVTGYGQAAYWNPSTHELNILGSNNWYIITRSTNSQSDTEKVAKLLNQGF